MECSLNCNISVVHFIIFSLLYVGSTLPSPPPPTLLFAYSVHSRHSMRWTYCNGLCCWNFDCLYLDGVGYHVLTCFTIRDWCHWIRCACMIVHCGSAVVRIPGCTCRCHSAGLLPKVYPGGTSHDPLFSNCCLTPCHYGYYRKPAAGACLFMHVGNGGHWDITLFVLRKHQIPTFWLQSLGACQNKHSSGLGHTTEV